MTCVLGENEWCSPTDLCFACADDTHSRNHPVPVEGCRTCQLRSVQLSPSCTPSKPRRLQKFGARGGNSWEKGIKRDERGMPLLKEGLAPIGLKDYSENHIKYESARRQLANT